MGPPWSNGITEFEPLMASAALQLGELRAFCLNGVPILLGRAESGCFAMLNRCSHAGSALETGRIRRNRLICPFHGAQFDVCTGVSLANPPYLPLPRFEVRELDGLIAVAVPPDFVLPEFALGPPPAL